MYHYVGCGLPYVYLKNGFELVQSPYGKGVTIHDLDGLHDALGAAIVGSPEKLTGPEVRFLRVELNLSQAGLASALGCNEQSVARWEKGRSSQVDAPSERILRMLYKEAKLGEKKLAPLLKSLQDLECKPPAARKFVASERKATWSAKTEALRA
jgi:DNA-binding transcriptional regulator YiaG